MPLNTAKKALLKSLANRGDTVAQALLDMSLDVSLVAGAEAVNVIKVTGQVLDGAGLAVPGVKDIVITSIPTSGAGTLTDGGLGVVKAGSISKTLWMETDANGAFQVDVLNAVAEPNLLIVSLGNGDDTMLELTFT